MGASARRLLGSVWRKLGATRYRVGIGTGRNNKSNGVPLYAYDDSCIGENIQPVCKKKGVGIDDGLVYHDEYEPVGEDEPSSWRPSKRCTASRRPPSPTGRSAAFDCTPGSKA